MGIPTEYNDESFATRCNFRPPNWVPEPVSMLPIPKDRVAMQECVGDNAKYLDWPIPDQVIRAGSLQRWKYVRRELNRIDKHQ